MVAIEKLLLNALQNLAVGYKMLHLMHAATIVFILMMLIVEITILLATFYNHTYTPHVVMMYHHRREQHTQRGHKEAEQV